MKIIKRGKLPGDRKWIGTCHTCKTKAVALESEVRVIECQREGPYATAKCPVCGAVDMSFYPKKEGAS